MADIVIGLNQPEKVILRRRGHTDRRVVDNSLRTRVGNQGQVLRTERTEPICGNYVSGKCCAAQHSAHRLRCEGVKDLAGLHGRAVTGIYTQRIGRIGVQQSLEIPTPHRSGRQGDRLI